MGCRKSPKYDRTSFKEYFKTNCSVCVCDSVCVCVCMNVCMCVSMHIHVCSGGGFCVDVSVGGGWVCMCLHNCFLCKCV